MIVPRGDRSADFNGHAVIITPSGETGNYTFQSIGHVINGTIKDTIGNISFNVGNIPSSEPLRNMVTNELIRTNGTALFHTASSGELSTVNNLTQVTQSCFTKLLMIKKTILFKGDVYLHNCPQ